MALLAEELVEEWLRRQGYFTIRGVKLGVQEVDLLALRPKAGGFECRHIEVQASVRPVSYLTPLTKGLQQSLGLARGSAKKRQPGELRECVEAWVERKFHNPKKVALRESLAPGADWAYELVVNRVRHQDEIIEIGRHVSTHQLDSIVQDLHGWGTVVPTAAGADFVDLVLLGDSTA